MGLSAKPWNDPAFVRPPVLLEIKGMLGDEERHCLYYLGREVFRGEGAIIDAGAYIGSSAYCFAAGVRENRAAKFSKPVIHSYDLFEAREQYVADQISAIRPYKAGDGYLDLFEAQNAEFLDLIAIHPGDLCDHAWTGGAIEILFIDVAKSRKLNAHVVREFFPALIPGKSIVIQQDFYHIWHPEMQITMEYLANYFEVVDPYVAWQSRVYRFRESIPAEEIDKVARLQFTREEKRALLMRGAAASPTPTREMMEAIAVLDAVEYPFDKAYFEEVAAEFMRRNPEYESSQALWAIQVRQVLEQHLKL